MIDKEKNTQEQEYEKIIRNVKKIKEIINKKNEMEKNNNGKNN